MLLYFIRHADPDYVNNTITAAGRLEAKALAQRMAQGGLDEIYCSPYGRAINTMLYTADAVKLPGKKLEWLKELDEFIFKQATPWPVDCAWEIPGEVIMGEQTLPTNDNWHEHKLLNQFETKGIFAELVANSDKFLAQQGFVRHGRRYKVTANNKKKIAVFGHGGFGLTWLAHLLNIPPLIMWADFWLAPSSVTTILFEQRSGDWAIPRCLGWGDTSHLYKEGLNIMPRGLVGNLE
jgi:probable phosphoglycerate mutase